MSRKGHYAEYESPNIVIVPTVSCYDNLPAKRAKLDNNNCASYSCVTNPNTLQNSHQAFANVGDKKTEKKYEDCQIVTGSSKTSASLTNVNNASPIEISRNKDSKIQTLAMNDRCDSILVITDDEEEIPTEKRGSKVDTKSGNKSCPPKILPNNRRLPDTSMTQTAGKLDLKTVNKSLISKASNINSSNKKMQNIPKKQAATKLETNSSKTASINKIPIKLQNESVQDISSKQGTSKLDSKSLDKTCHGKKSTSNPVNKKIQDISKKQAASNSETTNIHKCHVPKCSKFKHCDSSKIINEKCEKIVTGDRKIYVCIPEGLNSEKTNTYNGKKLVKSTKAEDMKSTTCAEKDKPQLINIETNASGPFKKSSVLKPKNTISSNLPSHSISSCTRESNCVEKDKPQLNKIEPNAIRHIEKTSVPNKAKNNVPRNLSSIGSCSHEITCAEKNKPQLKYIESYASGPIKKSSVLKPKNTVPSIVSSISSRSHEITCAEKDKPQLKNIETIASGSIKKSSVPIKPKNMASSNLSTANSHSHETTCAKKDKPQLNKIETNAIGPIDKTSAPIKSNNTVPSNLLSIISRSQETQVTTETISNNVEKEMSASKLTSSDKTKEKNETSTSWASNFMQSVGQISINKKRAKVTSTKNGDDKVEDTKTKPSPPKHVKSGDIKTIRKKSPNSKLKRKKYKKILLKITIMFNQPNESQTNEDDADISFLEDINVDEIVNILNEDTSKVEQKTPQIENVKPPLEMKSEPKDVVQESKVEVIPTKDIKKEEVSFEENDKNKILMKSVVKSMESKKEDGLCNHNPLPRTQKILAKQLEIRMMVYLNMNCTVLCLIKQGIFSRIYHCKDENQKDFAVKVLNKESDRYDLGVNKENMLMKVQRDIPKENLSFVYIYNGFSLSRYWCFLMDYYPKNLREALIEADTPFHIDLVQRLARQLISAVTILRNNHIIHSDIKPAHILLTQSNENLKLCGFDSAYYVTFARSVPNIGTVNYRAPEVILGYSAAYTIDVWSTAVVIHEMATGTKLFPGIYNNEILYKQMSTLGEIPFDMRQKCMFNEAHFIGTRFMKRSGYMGKDITMINSFTKSGKLRTSLNAAYVANWSTRTKAEQREDLNKINLLYNLLEQMLVLHPMDRLPIEFAYVNPFIYKTVDV